MWRETTTFSPSSAAITESRSSTSMKITARRDSFDSACRLGGSLALPRVSIITVAPSRVIRAKPTRSPSGTSKATWQPTRLKKSRVGSTRSTKRTGVAEANFNR